MSILCYPVPRDREREKQDVARIQQLNTRHRRRYAPGEAGRDDCPSSQSAPTVEDAGVRVSCRNVYGVRPRSKVKIGDCEIQEESKG